MKIAQLTPSGKVVPALVETGLLEIADIDEEEEVPNPKATQVTKPDYTPPPIDGDFYRIANVLNETERTLLQRVRTFTEGVVAPVIEDYWARDEFPFEIIPKIAEIGIGGVGYQGYGAAGGSWLLNGFVAMELARVDASVATFWGVHTGLSAGSIYLCGDEEQKQRWLPAMMRFDADRLVRSD